MGHETRCTTPRRMHGREVTLFPEAQQAQRERGCPRHYAFRGDSAPGFLTFHAFAECMGIHATKYGTRFEGLEPVRQGVRAAFGGYAGAVAAGLALRHDHGSQYMSEHFQTSESSSASCPTPRPSTNPKARQPAS